MSYDKKITRKFKKATKEVISENAEMLEKLDVYQSDGLDRAAQLQAKRYNKGKPRPSMIPPEWTRELMAVLEKGAEKYDDNNWKIGLPFTEVLDSLERHLLDFKEGIDIDPDDGVPVLSKIAVNALFLRYYQLRGMTSFDNRKEFYEEG